MLDHTTFVKALDGLYAAAVEETSWKEALHGVSQAADHMGITRNTARVHLQRTFLKTLTNSQSELVRLLMSIDFR